jgi:hypothetical protein
VVGNALVGGGDFILEKGLAVVGFLSFYRSNAMFKNIALLRGVQTNSPDARSLHL